MANVFSLISYLSDDEIRFQIALIDNVNITNAVKETGHKLLASVVDVANAFAETFAKKNVLEYEVKKVSDMVGDTMIKLKLEERKSLEEMLEKRIYALLKNITGKEYSEDENKERVSKILIDMAGSAVGVNKYLSPAHKLEEIRIKYNNAFLTNLKNHIAKMTDKEVKECAKQVDKELNAANMSVKREIQEALLPSKFNGLGIINSLKAQKTTGKLETVVKLLGADMFGSISVEVSTMYQAIKSLNSMSRMQLSRLLYKSAEGYGKKLYVDVDLLPSYVSPHDKETYEEADKELLLIVREYEEARTLLEKKTKQVEDKEKQLEDAREKYESAGKDYDEIQKDFTKLESEKDDFFGRRKSEEDTKKYYSNVNSTKRELDRVAEDYEKKKKRLHQISDELKIAKEDLEKQEKKLEAVEANSKERVKKRADELKLKWQAYFFRFKFEEGLFEKLILLFTREELLHIEEALKEAHDAKSMLSVAEDENKLVAYTGSKKPAIIRYEEKTIKEITRE